MSQKLKSNFNLENLIEKVKNDLNLQFVEQWVMWRYNGCFCLPTPYSLDRSGKVQNHKVILTTPIKEKFCCGGQKKVKSKITIVKKCYFSCNID